MFKTKNDPENSNAFRLIFFSKTESRLRAGWRLAFHTILLLFLSILLGIVIFIPIGLFQINFDSPLALMANELTLLFSITLATIITRRFIDKRSFISLGFMPGTQALKDIGIGIGITFFQMLLIFVFELFMGWTTFEGFAWNGISVAALFSQLMTWLIIFILVGWQEELLSRGYHLQTITSGLNLFWGLVISSSIFGILHLFNPGANIFSTFGIFLAGLFLALPFILTRQLWLSIGLHIGWNFFEGVVFGFPVSGLETFRLLIHKVNGPTLWTGGDFGPEAGLVVIPALLLGSLLVFFYTRTIKPKSDLKL